VITGEGIERIKDLLPGKKSLFWGQSGVGKSSIINKIFPGLSLNIGKISTYTDKGKHTTVTTNMINVGENTFIIDTPGIREIDPFGIRKEDLGHYFLEFTDYIYDCRFNTCTHFHEPECAVVEAVNNKKISEYRYDSYLRILDTIEEDIIF
jgi:ribosome biogenesis GTPase